MTSLMCIILFSAIVGTQCKSQVRCINNQVISSCGKRCEDTCKNVLLKTRPCPMICDPPACVCKDEFARHTNGTCLAIRDCPVEEFECDQNEEASLCGNLCENKCGQPQNQPCATICAPPACSCKPGFARKNDINCVRIADC